MDSVQVYNELLCKLNKMTNNQKNKKRILDRNYKKCYTEFNKCEFCVNKNRHFLCARSTGECWFTFFLSPLLPQGWTPLGWAKSLPVTGGGFLPS
jgi:hypothetical protein